MGNLATKNALLVVLAMAVGLTLGAVTKFGFGYDLEAEPPSSESLTTK
jgi:membrane protein YqaA with SNARE-associated domain